MADSFIVDGTSYTTTADLTAAISSSTASPVVVSIQDGDVTWGADVEKNLKLTVSAATANDALKDPPTSSTVTLTSDFAGTLNQTTVGIDDGLAVEDAEGNDVVTATTPETSLYKLIVDGADAIKEASTNLLYVYNSGFLDVKNGGRISGGNGLYFQGNTSVSGEGSLISGALLSLYGCESGISVTCDVKDGGKLLFTADGQVSNIGHKSTAGRTGTLNIAGGTVDQNVTMTLNADRGYIKISNSTVGEKTYYGSLRVSALDLSKATTAAPVTISINSADYANCSAGYKIIEQTGTAALDMTKISITLDGAAYTLGTTFGGSYSIKQVDNDLVLYYDDPYMLSSQNFVTDTTLSGTDKAYYRNPDENYSGFSSIYNVGSGSTLTIAEGAAVDLERNASGTKSIILVGANDYFASQGFEATGAGDLVVNGTLDVGQLNAMADGTITVNGELNITTACIEKGALIYNTGSTGEINCLNIFNNANATVTVNGLATLTLAGEPAHALKDNGATDTASRFVVNVTDADLADMTGDTHTILDVKSSSVSIADKFTVNVNGAAYTLGEQFTTASGDTYVINMGDADGDSTANDLILTFVPPPPITVSLGNTEIGGYQKMSEALQAIKNVDTGNDGPYTITLNGTATETASGTKYFENDIVLTGKGTVDYNGECWFGNSSAINITVDEGDITFNSGVINGRHNGSSAASQLTISNGRLQHTGGYITVNGTTRISGYGSTAVTDADGNVMYGYKLEDGSYVANLSTTKFHIADRYYENNGLALELKDFAYLHLGGADSAKGDTVIWKNEKGTSSAAQSFTAVIENSKLVAGNFEFNTAAHVLNISGQSVISVLNFGFKDTTDTTVCSGTATVNVTGMDSEISLGQISSAVTAINYTLELADFASAGMVEAGDDVELLTLNNADAALDAATVLSITIDGAAYTLGDEIVDDAGNKYVINMGDANGDSAENDLLVTLTEKAPEPVVPEGPGVDGGASTEPSQKVYINPYYNENTLGYFSDVVGEELVLGKNAFTSVAAAKKALGANADIEYCTSAWNSSFSGSSQLEGIAKISNNSGSMGFNYGNFVSRYNMANGALNLNKVTADTDFENFAMVNVSGSNLSGAIENNSFAFSGTGTGNNASGTAWFAQGGMVNISGSTVGEVTGYAYATLNGSDVDVLSNNNILFANVKLENGEISSISNAVTMSNGMAQINNSFVGLLENYAYATMRNSDVVEAANVTSLQSMGGANSIGSFTSNGAYSQIVNGYGSSLTLGDVTMNGSFDSIVNYGGTLVLTGNLKGVEMLYGYGDLVASDEQIKQLGGAEKVKQTYFGDIVDLGSTADGFSGKAAELADNTEAKAVIWDAATEGGLKGWLGIGSDVDVKDSVDYVKFTAAADGTLDITSSAWSSTGDKVSINGTDLAITDGAVSFGVTAGTEYLVKIERKDNNSMSYDMTLA